MIFIRHKYKLAAVSLILVLFMSGVEYANSDMSIEEIARAGMSKSQDMASSESSGKNIPNFSKDKADNHANEIDQLDDAEMKEKAEQKIKNADKASAEGVAITASNRKKLDGYEDHEMFTKAEEINADPIAAYERMTSEGCKEKENDLKNQYKKRTYMEKMTDKELYEKTCEKPAGNIICEKTLNVSCEATEECQAGGIVKGSMDTGVDWDYNYPNLRLGTPGTYYLPKCGDNECCQRTMSASFNLRDIKKYGLLV